MSHKKKPETFTSFLFSEYRRLFSLRVKWPEFETDNLPPSSAEIKMSGAASCHAFHRHITQRV